MLPLRPALCPVHLPPLLRRVPAGTSTGPCPLCLPPPERGTWRGAEAPRSRGWVRASASPPCCFWQPLEPRVAGRVHAEPAAPAARPASVVCVGQPSHPEPPPHFQPQLHHGYKRNSSPLPAQPRPRGSTRAGFDAEHPHAFQGNLTVCVLPRSLLALGAMSWGGSQQGRARPSGVLPCKPWLRDAEGRGAPAERVGRAVPAPTCCAAAAPGSQGMAAGGRGAVGNASAPRPAALPGLCPGLPAAGTTWREGSGRAIKIDPCDARCCWLWLRSMFAMWAQPQDRLPPAAGHTSPRSPGQWPPDGDKNAGKGPIPLSDAPRAGSPGSQLPVAREGRHGRE